MLNEGQSHSMTVTGLQGARPGFSGPFIFLTARTGEQDKLTGFGLGQMITSKPFSKNSSHACRPSSSARRRRSVYRFGEVIVDLDNYVIQR